MQQNVTFSSGTVSYLFRSAFEEIWKTYEKQQVVIVTDEHIAGLYSSLFKGCRLLLVPPGEQSKDLDTLASLVKELLQMEATRQTVLIGVGGGVVTDITGFLASVYMRGVPFGFVPTTLLAMVDAAVGGKNGVNLGLNKNVIGTISQPAFILYDTGFLNTLPDDEWSNGFAEIIKTACIFDAGLFEELGENDIAYYRQQGSDALLQLIERCVAWKNRTVIEDEKESGNRKLLNFGHTAAHAIEKLYEMPHGKAVAIGMVIACAISVQVAGLAETVLTDLKQLLARYQLPVSLSMDTQRVMEILRMDKKRNHDTIHYVLLERLGQASLKAFPFSIIENTLLTYESNN